MSQTRKLTIGVDEHVFIPGMTGSGKSVLAEIYLAGFEHVIKLDTKGEVYERRKKGQPLWRGLQEGKDFTVIERLSQIENVTTPKIIYVPHFTEDNLEHYDALMKWVYERENTTLWIDELMSITPNAFKYPPYLKAIYTRGRSKNVSVWALSQRPSDIPAIVFANSTHFFAFSLPLPQDRKKLVEATSIKEFNENPEMYHFWYCKLGNENATYGTLKL